jgi:hypothetical protein
MSDTQFINGIRFYKPNEAAPDFVIANGSINKAELLTFLETQPDELRFNVKMSKGGNFYGAIDTFTPTNKTQDIGPVAAAAPTDDALPF